MVQLEVLLYSNSMHSVYQAQYPKLFTYIAEPNICGHVQYNFTGNKRVLQLIITKTIKIMYRKLLPLVIKGASKLCVYSVYCWFHWV